MGNRIETRVVPVNEETRLQLEAAQLRQRMVNVSDGDELSGDDVPTPGEGGE